jgi:hypothetical protein
MIDHYKVSVRELLPEDFDRLESIVQSEISKEQGKFMSDKVWHLAASKVADAIRDRLNFDVVDLLGRGWTVARELHEYKDPKKHPSNETSVLYLGEHKMKTECHPVVNLKIGSIQGPELRFTLEFVAKVKSGALAIKNAHITSFGSGLFDVAAQLKYQGIDLHKPKEMVKVELPGKYDFEKPGLKIL